ncbi:MAG: transglycosylase domain-containing protein, partial [Anaerolineales bacterium]|nr:transglycosylase domain-containing protein [Anaerolineales bacterium]
MSATLSILRKRRKRRARPDRRLEQSGRSVGVGCGFIISVLLIFTIFSLVLSYQSITHDLPSLQIMEALLNPRDGALLQPTRIYDRSGKNLIRVFAPEDAPRRYIPIAKDNPQHLPDALVQATLALVDPGFWEHPGYRLGDLTKPESHPTLTQQLVADLLLWDEPPTLRRAIRERLLAAQLTQTYGRQQILAWWLNSANYGHQAYGAEAAAQLYFGKSASKLNPAEAASLAAAGQSPALNPLDAPTIAYQRRQETLHIMAALDMLDADQADAALRTPFNVLPYIEPENPAPAFLRLMFSQLDAIYPRERIERGGLTIISSLDLDLQTRATCAVATQVARLSGGDAQPCAAARRLPALPVMD